MAKLPPQSSLPEQLTAHGGRAFAYGITPETGKVRQPAASLSAPLSKPVPPVKTVPKQYDFYSSTVPVNNIATTLIGPNPNRQYLMIQNKGAVTAILGFGTLANLSGISGVELPPGAVYTFENGINPNNGISAVCATSTTLAVVEGVERG